jgi:hypothetical protein
MSKLASTIEVQAMPAAANFRLRVTIREGESTSNHEVTLSTGTLAALGGDDCPPEHLVDAAVRFLLDRETKESILQRFDVAVIGRYFPEFERALPKYLAEKSSTLRCKR